MSKRLIFLLFILLCVHISFAEITISTSTVTSTCSANGSISVNATGGTSPYLYQIISSSSGIIRPAQNVNLFQNLPSGTYTIRVTDINNETGIITSVIGGNYVPLSFTSVQQQSSIIIQPVNGKPPYLFSVSADGGNSYSLPVDSGKFHCLTAGSYLFRVYDSCSNFYTETVVVAPVIITSSFSCVPVSSTNTKSIVLNSLLNGNGGYVFRAFGVNYDSTNNIGNFSNINRCNKNITVSVTDRCNVVSENLVCPSPDYTFRISCVNFKDKIVSISNVSSGDGLPYQYIANDVASAGTSIQNFPITGDSILAGLIDSCGFKNTLKIQRMKILKDNISSCENGSMKIFSYYIIDDRAHSFPPTSYTSISGPSSFNVTDLSVTDTSLTIIRNLQTGKYVYKITTACGDEIIDSFFYQKKCFKKLLVKKFQSCNTLKVNLEKDCVVDTNALYTLTDLQGNFLTQNTTGIFNNLVSDSCYKIKIKSLNCDTTIEDFINPIRPKLKLIQNSCNEASFSVKAITTKTCGFALGSNFTGISDFVMADNQFNILQTNTTGFVNPVPQNTQWIYARAGDCNSDTLRYLPGTGFSDTAFLCITPVVRNVNNSCKLSWNLSLTNNYTNATYTLIGNGNSVNSTQNFYGIDSGRYVLKNGCNEQELVLPNYYNFTARVNPGCPSNASITASYNIDTAYINAMSARYFFNVCEAPPIDYFIKEAGSAEPLVYSTSGIFNNLKTGTYYVIFFKGNEECHFGADTIFTPFYTRPALSATYGLICNGNNATVKASVIGGTAPYTYEVLNSSIPPTTTDSNFVLYNNLALGTAQFRVNDACGISTDYSTEVLSVNFQPSFKKKCTGEVQLIAPDIFNTTYVWTNKNNDTIGTTPIVVTNPNGDDSFTVKINHLSCSISKSLLVSDFSTSIVNADAGIDFSVDTTTTLLHGNIPPANATGSWRQIDPSSGNTVFTDIYNPNTKINVDVFPSQFTYVWTLTDTAIGCVSEDTIVVSFLRCPDIRPILYTKTISNAVCIDNGKIEITITQASTPVHFIWNTGATTSSIDNLKDTVYIVSISDETSCTPDIVDTIFLSGSRPSFNVVHDTICSGDTIVINNKKYYTAGNYTDTLVNTNGCDSVLSIYIFTLIKYDIFDTVRLCANENYTLPNGQTITQSGNYIVRLQNILGCDSLLHYNLIFLPTHKKTIDTFVCSGLSYQLPNGNLVEVSGIYTDTIENIFGCDSIIETNLTVRDALSNLFLGNDTTICDFDKLLLTLNYPNDVSYLWQDSSSKNSFSIGNEGIYSVKISDACTSISDTIKVKTKDCSCTFYLPNAFSPNGDGINDIFKPFMKCIYFNQYSFSIFNRWGELLFETSDTTNGWDGIFKDIEQQMDTYIWTINYFDEIQNEKIRKRGNFILLK